MTDLLNRARMTRTGRIQWRLRRTYQLRVPMRGACPSRSSGLGDEHQLKARPDRSRAEGCQLPSSRVEIDRTGAGWLAGFEDEITACIASSALVRLMHARSALALLLRRSTSVTRAARLLCMRSLLLTCSWISLHEQSLTRRSSLSSA